MTFIVFHTKFTIIRHSEEHIHDLLSNNALRQATCWYFEVSSRAYVNEIPYSDFQTGGAKIISSRHRKKY